MVKYYKKCMHTFEKVIIDVYNDIITTLWEKLRLIIGGKVWKIEYHQ